MMMDVFLHPSSWTAIHVVTAVIAGLTAIVCMLSAVVLMHHAISDHQRRGNRQRFVDATDVLVPAVVHCQTTEELEQAAKGAERRFGRRAVALVLRQTRTGLRGEAANRVSTVLERSGTVARLVRGVSSKREWLRVVSVKGLGECGGEVARHALSAALEDRSPEVRSAAREALVSDASFGAVRAAIRSFLTDSDRNSARMRSFYARLATNSPAELLELLRSDVLQGADRKLPLEALGDAQVVQALPLAIMHLVDQDAELRATAARVLGRIGTPGELPSLAFLLRDDIWFVRAAAARAISSLFEQMKNVDSPQICELLAACLGDSAWWVRANAARALSHAGQRGAMLLLHVAEGEDRYARDAALATLALTPLTAPARARFAIAIQYASGRMDTIPTPEAAARMRPIAEIARGGVE
jgi:HEAT repeat protein